MKQLLPAVIGSVSVLAVLSGIVYIVDCRTWAQNGAEIQGCYLTGLPLMGIGAAGKGGYDIGYNTLNPALREPRRRRSVTDKELPDAEDQ